MAQSIPPPAAEFNVTSKPRIRKHHNKVRTGCLTCKIRRKKCDETKPACERCTRTGRKCDGYPDLTAPNADGLLRTPPQRSQSPFFVNVVTSDHCQGCRDGCLDCDYTGHGVFYHEDFEFTPIRKPSGSTQHRLLRPKAIRTIADSQKTANHLPTSDSRHYRLLEHETTQLYRIPSTRINGPVLSDIDRHCFTYFQLNTMPLLASYFEASIWRSDITRCGLAVSHPVLFSVAVALGAVHRRYNYGLTREGLEYCSHAEKFYNTAISTLQKLKDFNSSSGMELSKKTMPHLGGVTQSEVIVAGEILLGVFQAFQDDESASLQHVKNALKQFMSGSRRLIHSEAWFTTRPSPPRLICRFIHRLYCRAVEMLGPINIMTNGNTYATLPIIPDRFESLQQMRDFIFTDIDFMMHTSGRTMIDANARARTKAIHDSRLEKWSSGFLHLVETTELTRKNRRIFNLLHITRSATYIMIYGSFFVDFCSTNIPRLPTFGLDSSKQISHWSQDTELAHAALAVAKATADMQKYGLNMLATAKDLIAQILAQNGIFKYGDDNFEHSHICPDFLRVADDHGTEIGVEKWREELPGIDDMSQMLGVYGLAERVSETEEEAITSAVLENLPPDALKDCVDITCPIESRRILVRYYRPNDYGDGFIWTQEWWSFGDGQYLPSATGF